MADDGRLNRLLDYTKFHIGIYLAAAGGMISIIAAAKGEEHRYLQSLIVHPWALSVAVLLMGAAGAAGGIIASTSTQCVAFEELWNSRQGPHTLKILTGRQWALVEHGCFWASFLLAASSVLWTRSVLTWIGIL
jgi:hypothetical protein